MSMIANSNNLQELNRVFQEINQRLMQLEAQNKSIINDINKIKDGLSKVNE